MIGQKGAEKLNKIDDDDDDDYNDGSNGPCTSYVITDLVGGAPNDYSIT